MAEGRFGEVQPTLSLLELACDSESLSSQQREFPKKIILFIKGANTCGVFVETLVNRYGFVAHAKRLGI